ncbi:MAG: hypothetical protein IPJ25_09320 [Rhodocyclaceae bacterium]|nr:hypothetical protein [Rhodocyclaceae bacterium]MBK9623151.1 hypothetical protein [Rhodocyclaceae bacterium]MBL0075675.1 hypothetical protein [Rhodocyclaceae bacterium]
MRALKHFVVGSAMIVASGFAFAHNCPNEMKAIDAKLATNPKLSSTDAITVAQLRASAEELHKAGRHDQAMQALADAKKLLGI